MIKQVKKTHYSFSDYVDCRRWISYYYQIREILDSNCKNVLLIGVGDGIVPSLIERISGISIDTFDYDNSLSPTYCGDLKEISQIVKRKYDCVVCCQVLEHIEFDYFENILSSLQTICSKRFILSLPIRVVELSLYADIPKCKGIKKLRLIIQRFWINNFVFNGEHYWEVGINGKTKKRILNIINQYFAVKKNYHVPGYSYHWFVICDTLTTQSKGLWIQNDNGFED